MQPLPSTEWTMAASLKILFFFFVGKFLVPWHSLSQILVQNSTKKKIEPIKQSANVSIFFWRSNFALILSRSDVIHHRNKNQKIKTDREGHTGNRLAITRR